MPPTLLRLESQPLPGLPDDPSVVDQIKIRHPVEPSDRYQMATG